MIKKVIKKQTKDFVKCYLTTKFDELIVQLSSGNRVLGIDLGSKNIGLAISDTEFHIASPFKTLQRKKLSENAQEISVIIKEQNIGGLVIGFPINMNGTVGPRAQSTRDWSLDLAKYIDLPILLWDERMSTLAVERAMLTADLSRKKRSRKIDQAAAAYILQGALDAKT